MTCFLVTQINWINLGKRQNVHRTNCESIISHFASSSFFAFNRETLYFYDFLISPVGKMMSSPRFFILSPREILDPASTLL